MIMLPADVKIFVAGQPADLRRSFDGLAAMTRTLIKQDPLSGHLFVFANRDADRVKILFWDRTGFVLWYKRLESAIFHFPTSDKGGVEVDMARLTLLLDGIDLGGVPRASTRRTI
jgi:transposase